MKWNFFAKLPPEPLTRGLPPPDSRSLCPQLNLLNPLPPNKISGYATELMFLSEWREFPSAPCLAGKKKTFMTARASMLLKSRASLTCFRACFLPGRAKDLSASRYQPENIKIVSTNLHLRNRIDFPLQPHKSITFVNFFFVSVALKNYF